MQVPEYVPRPGDFPNLYTGFSDIQQFNNVDGLTNNTFTMPNQMNPASIPQEMWQMPMGFDWDWNNMSADCFPQDQAGMDGEEGGMEEGMQQ